MATVTLNNIWTGKSLLYDWSVAYTIYGRDFNPRYSDIPEPPSDWDENTIGASWETSFNLSWFQPGSEVCFCSMVATFENVSSDGETLNVDMVFQKYSWWWQNAGWIWSDSYSIEDGDIRWWYWYVGVDVDEIWTNASRYRFLVQLYGSWTSAEYTAEFNVSNLSFDDSLHPSWYIWVDGANINFVDSSYSSVRWYKHIITQDSSYSPTYVWTGKAWSIWIPSWTDSHIYYIDENGYKRRTNPSQTRFDEGNSSAGSSKSGYIWVSDGYYAEDWYAHLCYVNGSGFKRRIINWWVS